MRIERTGQLLVDGALVPGRIAFDRTQILAVEPIEDPGEDVGSQPVIAPGFIDLHIHGFGGADPLENLPAMANALARVGTTAFQPTLFPAAPDVLGLHAQALDGERALIRKGEGARILGTHLEGPFVNPNAAGALPIEDLATPSVAALQQLLGPAMGDGRGVGTITIAPELPGAFDLIEECERLGVRVSLGHSQAKAADALGGFQRGAVGVTHLFNAMTPMHHREGGLVGEALLRDGLFAEIIGDLEHVGPRSVELALAARGPRNLCLVSDALQGAGTGCDVFHSHGREHRVVGGTAYYPIRSAGADAQDDHVELQLAGSASSQLDMLRGLVAKGIVGLVDGLTMASEAPARALGLDDRLGALRVGHEADVVILDANSLDLLEVFVAGQSQVRIRR